MHHRLGYDLPERAGFGGLWSAMDERPVERSTHDAPRNVVARSAGATCPQVRSAIAAFLAATAPPADLAA